MEVESVGQAFKLAGKVQDSSTFLNESLQYNRSKPSPFIQDHGQADLYSELYNRGNISPRQLSERSGANISPRHLAEKNGASISPRQLSEKNGANISPRHLLENIPDHKSYSDLFQRQEQNRIAFMESFAKERQNFQGIPQEGERNMLGDGEEDGDRQQKDMPEKESIGKQADTVSPQVADVVDKVMSNDTSLIENQDSFNLSNASFHDTNSNSSDGESEFLANHVTSESTTTYVRDPTTGHVTSIKPDKEGTYFCHLCSFSGGTQLEFENHMTCHFEHICPHCDYKSRTEGRLKRHIKDFHTDDPPDGFGSKRNMGRPKVFRCKQCDFVATEKTEFWAHARAHIKDDKVLQCPRCPFVTEYKHHLEYHLRNHFGSKPFKCNKCNYSCVNKSMLNSHMKSHTNVYQYRCADCTYATKYCHSLKLHLRKYQHKPATVLNTDGSLPQGIDADASGLSLLQKRGPPRGPRGPRKDKFEPYMNNMFGLPQSPMHGLPPGMSSAMMSPYWPLLSQLPNGFHRPPSFMPNSPMPSMNPSLHSPRLPHHMSKAAMPQTPTDADKLNSNHPFKCNFCCYGSQSKQELYRHLMKVHASENQDLFSMFGLSSESLLEEQSRRLNMMRNKMEDRKLEESDRDELHVQTENENEADDQKSSPRSWSHPSPGRVSTNRNSRYSLPEMPLNYYRNGNTSPTEFEGQGDDIIKQMMNKFGSGSIESGSRPKIGGHRESPLDLTKRKYPFSSSPMSQEDIRESLDGDNHSSGESTSAAEVNGGQSPRKRSRKGKAFKLDTLCLKLQDKHAETEIDSENEFGDENEGELLIDETKNELKGEENEGPKTEDQIDENDGKEDEIEDIKNSLQFLNEGMVRPNSGKEAERRSPDSTRNYGNDSAQNAPSTERTAGLSSGVQQGDAMLALHQETEKAWRMLYNGKGLMPTSSAEQNGHQHNLMKLSAAAQQVMAMNNKSGGVPNGKYECIYCEIAFKDCVMYTMHMGYHGYKDPFKCNMCGHCSKDKVEFFLHIARSAHN